MFPLLLTLTFAVNGGEKAAAPNIEGKWLIVYAEEGGRRNTTWEQRVATVKGDTLSYSKDGDDRSLRLTYGPLQTVKATMSAGGKEAGDKGPMSGVFIAGQDYLCLSLNAGGAKGETAAAKSSGAFILILRRQR